MTLEELKQQRASTKKSMTRIKKLIEANGRGEGKTLSATELKCRLSIAEAYFKQIIIYQHKIECLDPEDNSRAELEDIIIAIQLSVQEQIGGDIHDSTFAENSLPLSNRNHSPALETINAFQITNDNYTKALDRLKARFDNNTLIFLENITSLFELPATCQPDGIQLRSLVDNASAFYSSLSSLGTDREIADALLIHITMGKIDEDSRNKWKDSLDFSKLPKWDDFINLLDRRCQYLQSIDVPRSSDLKPASGKPQKLKKVSSFAVAKRCCSIYNASDHYVANCNQFRGMDISKRFDKVKQLRLCMNCLSNKHQVAQCTSNFKCRTCSKSHHSLLHRQQVQSQSPQTQLGSSAQQQQSSPDPAAQSYGISHSHFQKSAFEQVILATAIVLVRGADGTYHPGRALLDSCSQVNFITDRFSQSLKSTRKKQNVRIYGIGESSTNIKHTVCSTIKSRFTDFEMPLDFCVTAHISYQPEPEIDISSWNLPQNISLADENFHKSKHIDLLIGTEGFFDLLSVGQIKLGPDKPTLQKTLFGWVVSGRYNHGSKIATPPKCLMTFEQVVDAKLERLWLLEEVNREKKPWTPEQIDCESKFLKTVSRNPEGRIIVRLPFKDNISALGQSFEVSMRRFLSQEKRLSHQPALKAQYLDFMDEFQNLKHMSLVTKLDRLKPHYFIPHHCVLKPTSTTTKLRVVFDASCKTTSQKSLNDILLVGPTIQENLFILLLKFRLYQFAISADIVKMFRQVLIHEDDRPFQSILWRNTAQDEISTYHINLAVRALHYLADTYAAEMPIGAQVIKNLFYVDDFLCGADTLAELARIKTEVTEILQKGCFELAKWHSNHPKFVDDNTVKNLSVDDPHITSALGITWDQKRDEFLFAFKPTSKIDGPINKRIILSIASSLFDPLGLLSPLIIRSKIIMQELWLLQISWDESVPQFIHTAWEDFVADLNSLSAVSVPRYCSAPNAYNIQLHGFCDSSIRGYGCCLYMRVVDTVGNISVKLLTAKSKVAPTKKKSLPKLELCGAKLLASLYDSTKSTYGHLVSDVFLWTDSKIVLFWLKQHSATLSAFVGNRVSDIQEMTAACHWRHVPTKCNPADIVSRGCKVTELSSSIWFSGPLFLKLAFEQWPENNFGNPPIEEINKEKRKSAFHANIKPNYLLHCLEKISSFTKILRVVSWLFRFRQPAHVPKRSSHLAPYDIQKALWCIVYNIQQQYFTEDIRRLKKNLSPEGQLKCLNPFLEETFGFPILKVGGRLEFANIPSTQKHPSILPSKCILVNCYVRHLHLSNYHAGAKTLVALIRNNFWIINAREACRRIVQTCVHCVRYKPKLMQQIMGHLPPARVNECRPFQSCAVDFCGPINTYLRVRGKVPYKTYVAVFVCMVTKAVHIEVVSDLSTDAFLAALKRLIARRGPPDDIYCDNATNFVGANNKLAELKTFLFKKGTQNDIHNYCCNEFINFHFIPPRAPHFGGLWEAAVKAAKAHLNRTMLNTRLTFEELYTALVEIEAVLNSRPISPYSSDPSDLRALTPADLLYGCALKSLPEKRPIIAKEICYMEHWARISAIKQRFWQQWSHDYLNELQCRTKWSKEAPNVSVGSMVVIHEDNLPPLKWAMGRVINCIPGKDQKIRVVDIRTTKEHTDTNDINRLYPQTAAQNSSNTQQSVSAAHLQHLPGPLVAAQSVGGSLLVSSSHCSPLSLPPQMQPLQPTITSLGSLSNYHHSHTSQPQQHSPFTTSSSAATTTVAAENPEAANGFYGLQPGCDAVLGRIGSASSVNIYNDIPFEQSIEIQKLRPGSGHLEVVSKMDGPIISIQILDVNCNSAKIVLSPDPLWKHASTFNKTMANTTNEHTLEEFLINLILPKGLGLSVVTRSPCEELAYLTFEDIKLEIAHLPFSQSLELKVGDFQIDNQLLETSCPIMFYSTKSSTDDVCKDAISLKAKLLPSPNKNAVIFEYILANLKPCVVLLEERLILKTALFLGYGSKIKCIQQQTECHIYRIDDYSFSNNAKRFYFENLSFGSTQVRVTVLTAPKLSNELFEIKKLLGLTLIKFEDALIEFDKFTDRHHFETLDIYIKGMKVHYVNQLKWHAASILGSVDFLGNPLGFANDLSEGVSGLIFEGSVKSLVKNVTHGISNSTAKLTETLSDSLGRVVLDEHDNETRQKILEVSYPTTGGHLAAGLKGFGFGLLGGVTSIVRHTYVGAQSDGFPGFLSGLGKGLVGTVTKPLIGVLDLASETASAVRETSRGSHRCLPDRKRLPRCVTGAPGGLLPNFSYRQSKGQQYLYIINRKNLAEKLIFYEPNLCNDKEAKLRLLVSTDYVRIFSRCEDDPAIMIECHLSEVLSCHPLTTNTSNPNSTKITPCFYIEISTNLPKVTRPRVRCQNEEIAERASRCINYAKVIFDEREHSLMNI